MSFIKLCAKILSSNLCIISSILITTLKSNAAFPHRRNQNEKRLKDLSYREQTDQTFLPLVYSKNNTMVSVSSVAQSCLTLCDPMNHNRPGLSVHHQLPEFTQTHVHWVGDAIQPSHPLLSPSSPALNLSQHQGLFQWVNSWHEVPKVLAFQLQHQSFQWTPRTDL